MIVHLRPDHRLNKEERNLPLLPPMATFQKPKVDQFKANMEEKVKKLEEMERDLEAMVEEREEELQKMKLKLELEKVNAILEGREDMEEKVKKMREKVSDLAVKNAMLEYRPEKAEKTNAMLEKANAMLEGKRQGKKQGKKDKKAPSSSAACSLEILLPTRLLPTREELKKLELEQMAREGKLNRCRAKVEELEEMVSCSQEKSGELKNLELALLHEKSYSNMLLDEEWTASDQEWFDNDSVEYSNLKKGSEQYLELLAKRKKMLRSMRKEEMEEELLRKMLRRWREAKKQGKKEGKKAAPSSPTVCSLELDGEPTLVLEKMKAKIQDRKDINEKLKLDLEKDSEKAVEDINELQKLKLDLERTKAMHKAAMKAMK